MGQIWKRRWLVVCRTHLMWSTTVQQLEDPSSSEERKKKFVNSVALIHVKKVIGVNSSNGRKFDVLLYDKTYNFRAASKEARDHWVEGLNKYLEASGLLMKWLKSDAFVTAFAIDERS